MKKFKLSENAQNILGTVLCIIAFAVLIFLASIFSACTANAKADIPENELFKLKMELVKKDSLVNAYHNVLYRVWIDKPNYFLDVLTESEEFDDLFDILCSDIEFEFKNEEDSLSQEFNWNEDESCIRVVRHVVIPQHTQEKLDSVFGK